MTHLSPEAQKIINDYLVLPFPHHTVSAPYFNNDRVKVRAALRVLIGKGSPREITEEAVIIALRDRIDLKKLSGEELKKFLVERNLGVDCSALAYYILDAESRVRGFGSLKNHLSFPEAETIFRKILTVFRPIENCNVSTFAHPKNSEAIAIADIQAGDMIILLGSENDRKANHVLIVHKTDAEKIEYTHSFRWTKEGKYDHGVRQGTITITNPAKPLTEQIWEEKNQIGEGNETWRHARLAERIEIRRFKW